jgi:hypothetical protein
LWFAKKTQVMLREQTEFKDGTIPVKALLSGDAPAS